MSAERLAILLRLLGACKDSRAWCRGKSLREAWMTCPHGEWLDWFWETLSNGKPPGEYVVLHDDSPPKFTGDGPWTTSAACGTTVLHRSQLRWNAHEIRRAHKLSKITSAANRALRRLSQR